MPCLQSAEVSIPRSRRLKPGYRATADSCVARSPNPWVTQLPPTPVFPRPVSPLGFRPVLIVATLSPHSFIATQSLFSSPVPKSIVQTRSPLCSHIRKHESDLKDIEHASPRQSYASNVAWKRSSSRTGTAYRAWENNLEPHHDISTVTGERWRRE